MVGRTCTMQVLFQTHISTYIYIYILYVFNQDLFIFILQRDFCRIPANPSSKFCRWLLLIIWKSGLIAGRKCPKGFQQSMAIKRFCIRHTFAVHTYTHTHMHSPAQSCMCLCVCVLCAYLDIRPEAAYSGRQCQFDNVPRKPERRFALVRHVNCKLQLGPNIQEALPWAPATTSRYVVIYNTSVCTGATINLSSGCT